MLDLAAIDIAAGTTLAESSTAWNVADAQAVVVDPLDGGVLYFWHAKSILYNAHGTVVAPASRTILVQHLFCGLVSLAARSFQSLENKENHLLIHQSRRKVPKQSLRPHGNPARTAQERFVLKVSRYPNSLHLKLGLGRPSHRASVSQPRALLIVECSIRAIEGKRISSAAKVV